MDPRLQRTQFAAQAASLADQFQIALAGYRLGAHHVEMTAPESSTAGGVQALQHIRLIPPSNDKTGRVYVVGNANRVGRVAELRSLEYIDKVSLERFGERSGFDQAQYAAFVAAAARFLENFGLQVTYATRAVSLRPATAAEPKKSNLVVALVVVWSFALLAIGIAVGVAMHGRPH